MVSAKFLFKSLNFTENVWLLNFFATQQFFADISLNIACEELKLAENAQVNQL